MLSHKKNAKEFKKPGGLCFGFSSVWLYSKWLQFEHPEKTNTYDGDWYKYTVTDILGPWSYCDNVKDFAFLVNKLQNSQYGSLEKDINQIARLLLKKGANPNLANKKGHTALIIAIAENYFEIVDELQKAI
ncbi:hypothetical protein GAMM_40053 [Gammaproteobacteria bacterium]